LGSESGTSGSIPALNDLLEGPYTTALPSEENRLGGLASASGGINPSPREKSFADT